jgi:hypothetical protein
MRKGIAALVALFMGALLLSCSTIKVEKDDFKNAVIVKMNMDHSSRISGFTRSVYCTGGKYEREIKEGKKNPTTVFFRIQASDNVDDLTKEAYVKVDSNIVKLELTDIKTDIEKEYHGESKLSEHDKEKVETKVQVTTTKILSGTLVLTSEIEESILKATSMSYRLYSKTEPVELKVSESQLQKIKMFLSTTGEGK